MSTWSDLLKDQKEEKYFKTLTRFIDNDRKVGYVVFPEKDDIMNAFKITPFEKVKVVILGQDPYHGLGQAHGLSFSVRKGNKIPPSLQNIYKELASDIGTTMPSHGELTQWATQGVFLLNNTLTVRKAQPNSHETYGWTNFTNFVIKSISDKAKNTVVFLLWGKFAQGKRSLIDETRHKVLAAPHPSPFSATRGFFGSKHFSETNKILVESDQEPIDWQIT